MPPRQPRFSELAAHPDAGGRAHVHPASHHRRAAGSECAAVGHYGCSGVQAALEGARIGLADNWIRHIQDVRHRHRQLLDSLPDAVRANALCDINVIEQVVNVSVSTVMVDAWARGQGVTVHGWAFGVNDGLLQDLQMSVTGPEELDGLYRKAVDRVWDLWTQRGALAI